MEQIISNKDKIDALREYYKNKQLLIIGLNDSQGVNTTASFFKKGLLEYLASTLASDDVTEEVINAFSLTFNKTEHVDSFLKNNMSLREIKLSQIYSVVSALEKVMEDIGLPKCFGQLGQVYRLIYTPKKGDENIRIATSLKASEEPILIYSSGANDLMREIASNPFCISRDYKKRNETPNYNYTLDKVSDPKTLKKVITSIKNNYETILGINDQTDVYALGIYVPKSLQSEAMEPFRELIMAYNEELKNLTHQYDMTYIDTEEVGQKYNESKSNFHITTAGHNALTNHILSQIYENKCTSNSQLKAPALVQTEISQMGAEGVLKDTLDAWFNVVANVAGMTGYEYKRQIAVANEYQRQADVMRKVLKYKKP